MQIIKFKMLQNDKKLLNYKHIPKMYINF